MSDLLFLKLGGSLITDKTGVEAVRPDVLDRLAAEIAAARSANSELKLLLGHGSGSFGHVAAAKYGTRRGVHSPAEWAGFAEVSSSAARLNRLVVDALQKNGVPAIALQPSASVVCENGRITYIATHPIQSALAAGLVPVVYGDVAFDVIRGGTIISTEEVMMALASTLQPRWLLLAGETEGVLDENGRLVPTITRQTLPQIVDALGGSRGTDVTGGMAGKVISMLDLVDTHEQLQILIFSGLVPNRLQKVLLNQDNVLGTVISRFSL
ncbi:MAG: isopentenyl phosphate kinase family protein [Anaerolineales bacterium]|nr:isopentenyl phosphate kinase family protein [Anaerolineales bacterium]